MFAPYNTYHQMTLEEFSTYTYMSDRKAKAITNSEESFFFDHVTKPLLENSQELFGAMYSDKGRPCLDPAILSAVHFYKALTGLGDRKLCEEELLCNQPLSRALGLGDFLSGASIETWNRSTLYDFRNRCKNYRKKTGIDVQKKAEEYLIEQYKKEMGIDMSVLRSDSTLISANIKVVSRSELLYDALRFWCQDMFRLFPDEDLKAWGLDVEFYKQYIVSKTFRNRLHYYQEKSYAETCEIHMDAFAKLASVAANADENQCPFNGMPRFELMTTVFHQQCVIVSRDPMKLRMATSDDPGYLKADNIQSIFDPDATFRQKNDVLSRGYTFNTVEALNQGRSLIVSWDTEANVVSDINMLKVYMESLEDAPAMLSEKAMKKLVVDGAYYSEEMAQLCARKGYKLWPTDLTGTKTDTFLAGFKFNAEGTRILECPNGKAPIECKEPNAKGVVVAYMDAECCNSCPHKEKCPLKNKNKVAVSLTVNQVNRAKVLLSYGTEEGEQIRHTRNGVEGIQNLAKNVYCHGRMVYKSLIRNQFGMTCVVGAINFRKLWAYHNGEGNYVANPLLS